MARLWTDGAELQSTGTLDHSDSGTAPSINTTTKHSGAASYRINASGSSIWFGQQYKASDSNTQAWFRAYVYFATLPSAEAEIMSLWTTGGSRQLNITVDNAGAIRMRDSGGTQKGSTSSALSTSTWYRIEFTSTVSAGSAVMEARIDGSAFATASNGNVGNHSRFLLGCPAAGQTYDIYYDDMAVNDSSGSAQTSWPGDGSVVYIRPDAAGDNNDWLKQGGGAGSSTNYQDVDETTPDDATTYLKRTSTGAKVDDYNMASSASAGIGASDTITLIQVGARVGSTSTTATGRNYAARIKSQASGTVTTGATAACNVNGWTTHVAAAPKNYQLTSYTDPQAGGAWTPSLIDSAQIGITTVTSSSNEIRVSAVWALVEYVPSTTQDVSLPAISSGATLYAPTLTVGAVDVTLPAIASGSSANAPTLAYVADLPTMVSGAVLYAPTLVPGAVDVALPTIATGATTAAPTLAYVIALPTISSGATVHAMTLTPGAVEIVLAAIASEAALYEPTVANAGGATQDITLPTIASGETLYAMTITVGTVDITLPTIVSGATLLAPSLSSGTTFGGGRGLRFTAFRPGPHPDATQAEPAAPTVVTASPAVSRLVVRSRARAGEVIAVSRMAIAEARLRSAARAEVVADNGRVRISSYLIESALQGETIAESPPAYVLEGEELAELMAAGIL